MSSSLSTEVDMYAGSQPRVPRSRAPDPDFLCCETSPKTMGIPLTRVSTAPVQDCAYLKPQHGMFNQERQVARASKLVKMGSTPTPRVPVLLIGATPRTGIASAGSRVSCRA